MSGCLDVVHVTTFYLPSDKYYIKMPQKLDSNRGVQPEPYNLHQLNVNSHGTACFPTANLFSKSEGSVTSIHLHVVSNQHYRKHFL